MPSTDFKNVTLVEHPLISRDISILRDKHTPMAKFRTVMGRMAIILAYHALKERR